MLNAIEHLYTPLSKNRVKARLCPRLKIYSLPNLREFCECC